MWMWMRGGEGGVRGGGGRGEKGEEEEEHQVYRRSSVCSADPGGRWVVASPYTQPMLMDWQRASSSSVVPLQTWWSSSCSRYIPPCQQTEKQTRPQNCFSHSRPSALGRAGRATDLGDQGEAQQAAGGADGQQHQLPPAALAQVGGEKVHQRGHQALQAYKLQAETPAERSVCVKGRWAGLGLIPGAGLPRCPGPAG